LVLNWEKYHFMVQEGVVLDHIVFNKGIEVDKTQVEVTEKITTTNFCKASEEFSWTCQFLLAVHKGFFENYKTTHPIACQGEFNKECVSGSLMLKEAFITAPVMHVLDWELPFLR